MLMKTSLPVFFWISCLSLSTSCPLRPMMMPGREVKMLILSLLAARSMSTRETPAWAKRFFRSFLSSEVLVEEVRVLLLGVPAAAPGLVEPEPEPDRVDFLTHSYFSLSATWTVRWAVRLRTW